MKLLVTGGAGFIGSAVIRHIITHTQDEVVNLDKRTYAGNPKSRAEVGVNERSNLETGAPLQTPRRGRVGGGGGGVGRHPHGGADVRGAGEESHGVTHVDAGALAF